MASFTTICVHPFLVAQFEAPQNMLSWSLTRPGFVSAQSVAWLYVRNDELPLGVDPAALLLGRMRTAGHEQAVHLMTSRDVAKHHVATARFGSVRACCLATVGLGNAGRVGARMVESLPVGTINLLAHVDCPLATAAMIEAISIASEARTAALIDLDWRVGGAAATGTGTDCIVVAAPKGLPAEQFAGLHTDVGAALGRAVYDAVRQGGQVWMDERE